jgi:hypothetical protein
MTRAVATAAMIVHTRVGFRPEVLHDHLLDVAVPPVEVADREERRGTLRRRLSDADEDAGRERDRETTRVLDRADPHRRDLVRRAVVRHPTFHQSLARLLEHQAHRRGHVLEPRQVLVRHHAGVEVREQSRLLDHADRHRPDVVERRVVAAVLEPLARDGVSILGLVAEREERLLASGRPAGLGDRDDLLRRQVRVIELRGRLGERAVVAHIPTQHGERDEDLPRVRDRAAAAEVSQRRRDLEELGEALAGRAEKDGRLIECERLTARRARERPARPRGRFTHPLRA